MAPRTPKFDRWTVLKSASTLGIAGLTGYFGDNEEETDDPNGELADAEVSMEIVTDADVLVVVASH